MNNKLTSVIIGIILLVGIGVLVYTNKKPMYQYTKITGLTIEQISAHKDSASCWTTIYGNVYDLTSWIPKHPGGDRAILSLCGKDGTEKFTGKHGGDLKIVGLLGGFKIGILIN